MSQVPSSALDLHETVPPADSSQDGANSGPMKIAPPSVPLRSRLAGAAAWVAAGSVMGHILRLAGNLVVTRLLAPEMFGLVAIATTVTIIASLLSDVGIHQNIIRSHRGDDATFLNTAWTVQIVRGLILWAVALLISLGIHIAGTHHLLSAGSAYTDPILPLVIAVSSFTLVISGFQSTKSTTAYRSFQVRTAVLLEVFNSMLTISTMIAAALIAKSVWSLVIAGLLSQTVNVILSHVVLKGHPNRLGWDSSSISHILSFGKWLFLSSAIYVFASQGDRLILAGLVNAEVLGMYSIAVALAGALDMVIHQIYGGVFLPAFSEIARKDERELPAAFFRVRRRFDPLIVATSGALFALGPTVIGILYDPRYSAAGQMLSILSLSLLLSRTYLVQQAFLALNKPKYLVSLNIIRLASIYTLIPLGYWLWGIPGALLGIALRELPAVPLMFRFNARHGLNNFRLELGLLLFWPAGFAVGEIVKMAKNLLLG